MHRRPLAFLLVAAALAALALPNRTLANEPAAIHTIAQSDLLGHIEFLASEELEGRGLGEKGGRIAQRYLASYYQRLGLEPAGEDGTYFQEFVARGKNGRNVLAKLPGTDPTLRDECIVIAGHVDHLGRGRGGDGPVYNGADDNASGTASILELAEAFTAARPRRSIIFFNTDGEESGLLGSRHWLQNPTFPVESIVTLFCMDMIGRSENGYLFVGGLGTSPTFPELVNGLNERFRFELETADGGNVPTDSAGFYKKECPVLFFFTNMHDDYHRPTDDIFKLNLEGLEKITQMIFLASHDVANRDERPTFTKNDSMAMPKDFMTRMRDRMMRSRESAAYLGVGPDPDADGEGFVIGTVSDGAPSAKAGLQPGDRILAIADMPVEGMAGLRRALAAKKPGDTVSIKLVRGNETLELPCELGSMAQMMSGGRNRDRGDRNEKDQDDQDKEGSGGKDPR